MSASAVLLAAGIGQRMGAGANKVLLELDGRPLLAHTLDAFREASGISEIVLVVRPGEESSIRELLPNEGTPIHLVLGGAMRRDSALAGVRAAGAPILLVHDGARPLVSQALIERVIDATRRHGAALPVLPATDTLHVQSPGGELVRTLDRRGVVRAQTPQGFRRDLLLEALEQAPADVTDDAAAVRAIGHAVVCVPGEAANVKITHPEDLRLAVFYLRGTNGPPPRAR